MHLIRDMTREKQKSRHRKLYSKDLSTYGVSQISKNSPKRESGASFSPIPRSYMIEKVESSPPPSSRKVQTAKATGRRHELTSGGDTLKALTSDMLS